MNKNVNVSLQILMLNDLLRTNVIDKEIYERAVARINAINSNTQAA